MFLNERPWTSSRVIFVSASAQLADCAAGLGFGVLKVGEEAVFDFAGYSFSGEWMKRWAGPARGGSPSSGDGHLLAVRYCPG